VCLYALSRKHSGPSQFDLERKVMLDRHAAQQQLAREARFDRLQDKFQSGKYTWQRSKSTRATAAGNSFNPNTSQKRYHPWGESEPTEQPKQQTSKGDSSSVMPDHQAVQRSLLILNLQGYRVGMGTDPLTSDILKKAFQRQALKSHPDHGGTDDQFRQVTDAYKTLQSALKYRSV